VVAQLRPFGIRGVRACLWLVGYAQKWSKWTMFAMGVLVLWSGVAFIAVHFGFNVNDRTSLPTQDFFHSGTGRVLDIGAGTGRSSIMVLEARPRATLVALDLFADSFDMHFGQKGSPQDRLTNLKAAGVDQRASIVTSNMRKLPFEAATFDAIVSSYAIHHVNRPGIIQTLAEAARVLKPGGDFLLMVVNKDAWLKFTFGPLLFLGGTRPAAWWTARVQEAGFQVLEEGTPPATLYVLTRR